MYYQYEENYTFVCSLHSSVVNGLTSMYTFVNDCFIIHCLVRITFVGMGKPYRSLVILCDHTFTLVIPS